MIENCDVYIIKTEELVLSDDDYKEVGWVKWNK